MPNTSHQETEIVTLGSPVKVVRSGPSTNKTKLSIGNIFYSDYIGSGHQTFTHTIQDSDFHRSSRVFVSISERDIHTGIPYVGIANLEIQGVAPDEGFLHVHLRLWWESDVHYRLCVHWENP
jgi:hypothetical protein